MITDSILEEHFPFCNQQGTDSSMINKQKIRQLVLQELPLSISSIKKSIEQHLLFLQTGGAGGTWKTIHIKGIVVALYFGAVSKRGQQASFERKLFPKKLNLQNVILPFANFCSSEIAHINFQNADLSYSICTDTNARNVDFQNAQLAYTDFTRADLEGANFQKANLFGADFENCNLSGANFKGANLVNTRFPGAILTDILI